MSYPSPPRILLTGSSECAGTGTTHYTLLVLGSTGQPWVAQGCLAGFNEDPNHRTQLVEATLPLCHPTILASQEAWITELSYYTVVKL